MITVSPGQLRPANPHFDHHRIVWRDEYSGHYRAVDYGEQFDDQWRLFLERRVGFCRHTGVETSDPYVDDRIFELTGAKDLLARRRYGLWLPMVRRLSRRRRDEESRVIGGRLHLHPKFAVDHFQGKRCLDIGCGAGRWTRALLALGAEVKSTDVSRHAVWSTRRFNDDVESLNLFDILERRPDLHGAFDFTLCWGVMMCTHDPKLAFTNVARTVRPGGELYAMVYAPTYHNSPFVLESRRHYHRELATMEERLQYAYEIADRPENAINLFDMLNPFFNWTIEEDTIRRWYRAEGFTEVVMLNQDEPHKCAFHVLGRKTG